MSKRGIVAILMVLVMVIFSTAQAQDEPAPQPAAKPLPVTVEVHPFTVFGQGGFVVVTKYGDKGPLGLFSSKHVHVAYGWFDTEGIHMVQQPTATLSEPMLKQALARLIPGAGTAAVFWGALANQATSTVSQTVNSNGSVSQTQTQNQALANANSNSNSNFNSNINTNINSNKATGGFIPPGQQNK